MSDEEGRKTKVGGGGGRGVAIRAPSSVRHRCARARAHARTDASRILKIYTSDGKSGVKYKSVMPPKNSVGAEPPVFPSTIPPPSPTPRCSSPSLPLARPARSSLRTLFRSGGIASLFYLFFFHSPFPPPPLITTRSLNARPVLRRGARPPPSRRCR